MNNFPNKESTEMEQIAYFPNSNENPSDQGY